MIALTASPNGTLGVDGKDYAEVTFGGGSLRCMLAEIHLHR
jgi:hypothetical protein